MKKLPIYNLAGEVVGQHELSEALVNQTVKPVVVQQVVTAQAANRRKPWAHTKGRSEVSGGGKKPWKQKGTGRARHGSIRSPLWKGGGVTFGPRAERNYSKQVAKKAKQAALRMVLADKVANERIILVENYDLPEQKTKLVQAALQKLPVKGKHILAVVSHNDDAFIKAARNLPSVEFIPANSLNVMDVLKAQTIIVPVSSLALMNDLYAKQSANAS